MCASDSFLLFYLPCTALEDMRGAPLPTFWRGCSPPSPLLSMPMKRCKALAGFFQNQANKTVIIRGTATHQNMCQVEWSLIGKGLTSLGGVGGGAVCVPFKRPKLY